MDQQSKIFLIAGPTASGKSDFAIKLAKKINGEIINADSMQVYKQLKVLTARPKSNRIDNIIHHLYGFLDVKKNFSTGQWLKLSIKKIKEIQRRKKIPILVGGTGLYFKALTDGLVKIPNVPLKIRNETRKLQKKYGQTKFYKSLIKLDKLSKNKINQNDIQRSLRAYEVKKFTKISLFEWFKKTKKNFETNIFEKIYINYPRQDLIKRINQRTEQMFKKGAIIEIKKFLKLKIRKENSSNKVIGVAEISNYLKKNINFDETKEIISLKTRQYAKRQSTWARGQMTSWQKIEPQYLKKYLKKF